MKIRTKLISILVISMLSLTVFFTINTIQAYEKHLSTHLQELKEEAYKVKKSELINYSDMANKVLESYYERTKKDKIQKELKAYIDEQSDYLFNIINRVYDRYKWKLDDKILKNMILNIIKDARYGRSGYFWINDFNYKMIMHPIKPEYNGKYFINTPKVPFVKLGVDKLKQLNLNRTYIQYSFYSPSSKRYEEKASVVRVFKPYNWIIGTGAYIDDLTAQMQKEALNAIKNMRYGKNGYFWINDMDNKMLMHPIKPQYDGKVFVNTPKVPFVELGTKKLKETQKDKVFIEYSFYTPSTKKYSHKLSIVHRFKPWDWVVGTGVYTDYLDAKIEAEKKIAQEEMSSQIRHVVLISLAIMVIMIIVLIKLMEKIIIEPLNKFQYGLNRFFKYLENEKVVVEKLDNISDDEIGMMAKETNKAIEIAVLTHKELLNLRNQLEKKVETTTKSLDILTKNRDEALEYGALIQKSIIPNDNKIKELFTDYFILKKQNDIITSQFYIFEKINDNEYIYGLIDCKKDGINGVFVTMLINALIKQALTQIKYENQHTISTAWILDYINKNIENSNDGFDGAIVYYNKLDKIIKYSSSNISLYYYKDSLLNIIKMDEKAIGIDSNTTYKEETLEVGEYLELYLSTNSYIDDNISLDEKFISPFSEDKNIFESSFKAVDKDTIVIGFQIDNTPKIIIEHEGEFTQELANKYMEIIEDKIENIGLMSNISTIFVEQYQNIFNYGKSKDQSITQVTPYGYIKLQKNPDETYSVYSKNIVSLADKQKIEPKLLEISSLDRNGIRKRYRELRRSGENTHCKGGGVGFYEIAKRCTKIEYEFVMLNDDRFEFSFVSYISSSKK